MRCDYHERPLLREYMEDMHEQMQDDQQEGKDKQDVLFEIADSEASTMTYETMDKLFVEFGIHLAYQSYYETFGIVPENQRAIIWHILRESYLEEYQDEMD